MGVCSEPPHKSKAIFVYNGPQDGIVSILDYFKREGDGFRCLLCGEFVAVPPPTGLVAHMDKRGGPPYHRGLGRSEERERSSFRTPASKVRSPRMTGSGSGGMSKGWRRNT